MRYTHKPHQVQTRSLEPPAHGPWTVFGEYEFAGEAEAMARSLRLRPNLDVRLVNTDDQAKEDYGLLARLRGC